MQPIFDFVKEQRTQYRAYTIEIADGYEDSQYQTLRTIELYHNSKFLTGTLDSLKREKPFYNVTKFRVNVVASATDGTLTPKMFRYRAKCLTVTCNHSSSI